MPQSWKRVYAIRCGWRGISGYGRRHCHMLSRYQYHLFLRIHPYMYTFIRTHMHTYILLQAIQTMPSRKPVMYPHKGIHSNVKIISFFFLDSLFGLKVTAQMDKVHHVSNLYFIPEQAELAKWLVASSCANKAFFCNSGILAFVTFIYGRNMSIYAYMYVCM